MFDRDSSGTSYGRATSVLVAVAVVTSTVVVAGAFAVGASAPSDGDGNNDTRENAESVQMNSTLNGTIDSQNDTDWYAVEAGDVRRVLVGISPHNFTAGDEPKEYKDVSVTLYDSDGEKLTSEQTVALLEKSAGVNHAAESGGTYYIEVASEYDADAKEPERDVHGEQPYTLDVESVALDTNEPNDQPHLGTGNATAYPTGETVSANFVGLDEDKYAVDLEAGETIAVNYDVTARLNHDGAAMPTKVFVNNASGERLKMTDETGNASFTFTAPEDGTYLVTPSAETDSYAIRGIEGNDVTVYELTITVDDGNDDSGDAGESDDSDDSGDTGESGDSDDSGDAGESDDSGDADDAKKDDCKLNDSSS